MQASRLRTLWLLALGAGGGVVTCAASPVLTTNAAEQIAISTLGLEVFLAALAVGLALPSGNPSRRLGLGRGRLDARSLALLALGTVALSHASSAVLQVTGLYDASALAELDQALAEARGRSLGFLVLGLVLAPALAEELFCRGLVQRGLERRLGPGLAIALASLFFGALHLDPIHAAAAALLGAYLGAIAWLAGSVRASIVCHAANNSAALVLGSVVDVGGALVSIPIGLVVAAVALRHVWQRQGPPPPPEWAGDPQPQRNPVASLESDAAEPQQARETLQGIAGSDDA